MKMFWCEVGLMCDEFFQITAIALLTLAILTLYFAHYRNMKRIDKLEHANKKQTYTIWKGKAEITIDKEKKK